MSTNVIAFPKKPRQSLGVRAIPSLRADNWFEVQKFEDGQWRAKAVYRSQEDADRAAKKLVEAVIVERIENEGDFFK